tara:strand:+ start:5155 stop:5304 length:150 start_codon:yes stop_codon:yes gene_type:complete
MIIRKWVMQLLGINNKIKELEDQIKNMERDIAGLKMEADVLYAKTLERE